eukprot:symbB.v1.2.007015.t1/scaffold385.1/size305797/11
MPKLDVSGLWKVLGRHTTAGRCLWTIYGEKVKDQNRPKSPRASRPSQPRSNLWKKAPPPKSPDFSDLCVRVVLQCARASCGFRVTGVTDYYCCQACEDGDDHDSECLQMPLSGFSIETRSERGFADYQHFSNQLRRLLEEKGPQHVGSLPHVWDAEYGSGSWAKSRPVKSASKAGGDIAMDFDEET